MPNLKKSMKLTHKILLIIGLTAIMSSCRQDIVPNELLPKFDRILQDPTALTQYDFSESTPFHHIALPFDFGSNQFHDSLIIDKLENTHIKYITYIYSDYKKVDEFKQEELNRERLYGLYQYMPNLFDDDEVEWSTIVQTGGQTEKQATNLFHGFVVHYRPSPTMESMKAEIDYLKSMIDTALTFVAPTTEGTSLIITLGTDIAISDSAGFYYERELDFSTVTAHTSALGTYDFGNYFNDTTVSAVLNRNKHWDKMLIHCDLTGSMSPYSAQLFVWHRLNIDKNKVQHFVFFNDGDMTPDDQKKAGKTGGIYYSKADNFDDLQKIAYECMSNGSGGDAPENDIEAMLEGFKKCKDCKDIILIADNWANLRDYEFINKIDRPVRIILCGTQFGINKQYLDLARATKGSIHTIEEDIENLMDLKEGQEITINGHAFVIENGRFTQVKKI